MMCVVCVKKQKKQNWDKGGQETAAAAFSRKLSVGFFFSQNSNIVSDFHEEICPHDVSGKLSLIAGPSSLDKRILLLLSYQTWS